MGLGSMEDPSSGAACVVAIGWPWQKSNSNVAEYFAHVNMRSHLEKLCRAAASAVAASLLTTIAVRGRSTPSGPLFDVDGRIDYNPGVGAGKRG